MKLLLLLCFAGMLGRGLFDLALPAPLNLTMSSEDFKHELRWTAAPGSPPGSKYHVSVFCFRKRPKVAVTTNQLWAEIELANPCDIYTLCVRSHFKRSKSPWSQRRTFKPHMDTNITAPNVTLSGCGKCIQVNITFPMAHKKCGVSDLKIYPGLSYKVSWRQKQEEALDSIKTENQTVVIGHLLQGTEYCVQVQPIYLDLDNFQPSPWKCAFTGTVQPPSPVFAVVGSVAALVVVSLSVVVLFVCGLQYIGIICKIKEALPHTLRASSGRLSLLRLEKTIPEPLFLLPETETHQHAHSEQAEEHLDTNELEQMEDQEDGLYMDRCADLSSDSSSKCSGITSSFQSAATVIDQPGSQNEVIAGQKDEHSQVIKNQECVKRESKDCTEIEEWHKELEKYESVNLFSVTITALDLQSDQEPSDEQPLVHSHELSDIGLQQPVLEDDSADQQTHNYYMRH